MRWGDDNKDNDDNDWNDCDDGYGVDDKKITMIIIVIIENMYVDDNYDNDDNDFNYCNDDNGGDDNDASYDSWYAKWPWLVKIRQNDYDITEWWRFMAKITFSEYFPVVVLAACFLPVWMANWQLFCYQQQQM